METGLVEKAEVEFGFEMTIRRVVETGIMPTINTGIAHKKPGIGQVGAGVVKAPKACFETALVAFGKRMGVA